MDTDWTNGMDEENYTDQLRDLQERNQSLANDVTMKEVIINSIEYKMFEVSNNVVKAVDFNHWIDGILHQKMLSQARAEDNTNQVRTMVDVNFNCEKQWKQMCLVLGKYVENAEINDDNYLNQVDQWMVQRRNREIKLEIENREYRNMIANIEETISKFGDVCAILKKHMKEKRRNYDENSIEHVDEWLTQQRNNEIKLKKENQEYKKMITNIENGISKLDFKIENFAGCLNTNDMNLQNGSRPFHDDSYKNILEYIQKEIRSFHEEDADFQVRDFPNWLEKIQCRMDDLEIDFINEQELRNAGEKQHAMEREILNYLFNQKQKEISILKDKLCNKSPSNSNLIAGVQEEDSIAVKELLPDTTL